MQHSPLRTFVISEINKISVLSIDSFIRANACFVNSVSEYDNLDSCKKKYLSVLESARKKVEKIANNNADDKEALNCIEKFLWLSASMTYKQQILAVISLNEGDRIFNHYDDNIFSCVSMTDELVQLIEGVSKDKENNSKKEVDNGQ